jgi:acetyltransferase-like isoleucine patch superfamily enzyme
VVGLTSSARALRNKPAVSQRKTAVAVHRPDTRRGRSRRNVKIRWPRKLKVGDSSWMGEGVWIVNVEEVSTGGDHAWIAAPATILRGVSIGDRVTVGATSLVTWDVPAAKQILAPLGVAK